MANAGQLSKTLLMAAILVLGADDVCRAQGGCQDARLTASDGGPFQSFGRAVAVSGNTALMSACCIFDWPTYVFSFDPDSGAWIETQLLLSSDGQGDWFGFAVTIDGDTALISAVQHIHEGAPGTGAVYVFRYNGSSWMETQELLASAGIWGDAFGASVSISGNLALIGAKFDDEGGSAYVFRFDGSKWMEEQKLLASDGAGPSASPWTSAATLRSSVQTLTSTKA